MKWFKADTDGYESEKICELENRLGLASVAQFYFLLMIVANKMDATDRCHVEYPVDKWCQLLRFKQAIKFHNFCKVLPEVFNKDCETFDKLSIESSQNLVKISIPKLLKKRDNHTKNLQANSKQDERRKKSSYEDKTKENLDPQSPLTPSTSESSETSFLEDLRAGGSGKYSETPQELAEKILKFLNVSEEKKLAERNLILKRISLDGIDFIRMKWIAMAEREADKNAPPIHNRPAYFFGSLNPKKP